MRNQYLSRPDVQKYLTMSSDITKKEKKELLAWIKDGNTPYSNDRGVLTNLTIFSILSGQSAPRANTAKNSCGCVKAADSEVRWTWKRGFRFHWLFTR